MSVPTPIRYLQEITAHIETHFGKDYFVLHEKKSSTVHVDVHVVMPNPQRAFFTLLTSGMSDRDMHVPKGAEDLALAEVCLCLPEYWPLSATNFGWREAKFFWPISILQLAARYPHVHRTWFGWGHSVPHSPPRTQLRRKRDSPGWLSCLRRHFPRAQTK